MLIISHIVQPTINTAIKHASTVTSRTDSAVLLHTCLPHITYGLFTIIASRLSRWCVFQQLTENNTQVPSYNLKYNRNNNRLSDMIYFNFCLNLMCLIEMFSQTNKNLFSSGPNRRLSAHPLFKNITTAVHGQYFGLNIVSLEAIVLHVSSHVKMVAKEFYNYNSYRLLVKSTV